MRIAVIGAGAIGGYVGGLLARAGADVVFIARGVTLAALRTEGLTIAAASGSEGGPAGAGFRVDVVATDDPAELGVADVVLHTTKATGFRDALEQALPMVGPTTLVVTVQNGVEAPEVAAELVGAERVVPGVVRLFSQIESPGVIEFRGGPGSIALATGDGRPSRVLEAFSDTLEAAGIRVETPADIWTDLWLKAMYVVPFGALGALTGDTLGVLRAPDVLRDALAAAASEIGAVGAARGVAIPEDAVADTLAFMDRMPAGSTASMQRDIREGKPSELDAQVGAICRFGDAAGVRTPLHDVIYRTLSARA